jgi:dTDP-4-dehydrorhamnose 3,5-epimerase
LPEANANGGSSGSSGGLEGAGVTSFSSGGLERPNDASGATGQADGDHGWDPVAAPPIAGVFIRDVKSVVIRNGVLTELYRSDWFADDMAARHVTLVTLLPGHVSQWHAHREQRDIVFPIRGHIKAGLFDDRESSPTYRKSQTAVFNLHRPRYVFIPPGIWHALKNVGTDEAAYVVVNDRPYDYADPDDWLLPAGAADIPVNLDG